MSQEHNERRFPRMPAEIVVLVSTSEPQPIEGFGKTRVVGLGGCCFIVPTSIGVGKLIDLALSIAGRVISASAQVVYELPAEKGIEVGVEFLRLDTGDRQFLRRYLNPAS